MRIKHNIEVPNDIILIHSIFESINAELYLVGGCVRDSLLNITPKDFDLVTNIIPDNVIELLKDEPFVTNIIETGKSFGVINVITADGEYEIATMREDIFYNNKSLENFKQYLLNSDIEKYNLFLEKTKMK